MYCKNRILALIFRLIMLTGCTIGLARGLFSGGSLSMTSLAYYTNLSNLVCWLFFIPLTVKTILDIRRGGIHGSSTLAPRAKGAVTMMITVTFLIFAVLLAPLFSGSEFGFEMDSSYQLTNILVHYFTPLMVLFDWIIFDPKNQFKKIDPILWLSIPYAYLAFALIRAEIGGPIGIDGSRYPYFFIDVDQLGWGGVALWVAGLTVFFTLLGYAFYALDKITMENGKLKFIKNKA